MYFGDINNADKILQILLNLYNSTVLKSISKVHEFLRGRFKFMSNKCDSREYYHEKLIFNIYFQCNAMILRVNEKVISSITIISILLIKVNYEMLFRKFKVNKYKFIQVQGFTSFTLILHLKKKIIFLLL